MAAPKKRNKMPVPRRRGRKKEAYFLLDPDQWGMAVGSFAATLVLVVDYFRGPTHALGIHVVVGAGVAFVVSYLSVALFVWYLRQIRDRELDEIAAPRLELTGLGTGEAKEAAKARTPAAGEGQ